MSIVPPKLVGAVMTNKRREHQSQLLAPSALGRSGQMDEGQTEELL